MNKILLVNKENVLSEAFIPDDLIILDNNDNNFRNYIDPTLKPMVSKVMLNDLNEFLNYAKKVGYNFIVDSGYRSYNYQKRVWDSFLEKEGLELTKQKVALPGASEHQTGLAIDFGIIRNGSFSDELSEEEMDWLNRNAYKYGFILRYPKNKEYITGYQYEGWHFRYVGREISNYMYLNDLTLEEYVYNLDNVNNSFSRKI